MDQAGHLNHLAAIAAAIATFGIGGLWYGPILGKQWMKANGLTTDDLKKGNQGMIFGISFFLALVQSYNLAMFTAPLSFGETVLASLAAGLGWVATALGIIYLFERKSAKLFWVNAGYMTVAFVCMGVILGVWK